MNELWKIRKWTDPEFVAINPSPGSGLGPQVQRHSTSINKQKFLGVLSLEEDRFSYISPNKMTEMLLK
jgi:hypothetical protein